MTAFEVLSLVSGIVSVVLAIMAIWLSIQSERRARESQQQTLTTLAQIDKRSSVTESIVGEHFQKLMDTVLNIVKSATTDSTVRTAEIQARSQEEQAKLQSKLMDQLIEVIQSGAPERVESFLKVFQGITQATQNK